MLLAATAVQDFDRFVARSVEAVIPARCLGHGRDVAGALNRARSRSSYPQLHMGRRTFPTSSLDRGRTTSSSRCRPGKVHYGGKPANGVTLQSQAPSWEALLGHGPLSIGSMKGDIQRAGCGRAPGCPIGLVTFTLE